MDPFTMLSVGSSLLSFGSKIFGGRSKKRAADTQAASDQHIANYNAANMENDAVKLRTVGVEKENDLRRNVAEFASRQRAAIGASGVVVDSGSAAAIQADTFRLGEIDARRIKRTYQDQADTIDDEAMLTRMRGKSDANAMRTAGKNAMLTDVITGGAQFAKSAYTLLS